MATIKPNENAPAQEVKYLLANEELVLASGGTHDSDDPVLLAAADAHPWLEVEYPAIEAEDPAGYNPHVSREDDRMSSLNSKAFDAEAIEAASADAADVTPLAVDASLDQGKAETVGEGDNEVAVTLAADETSNDDDNADAPKRRKRS